ncbi:MAG: type IV pili methyl-accepting chemotaxis transducer N-terminal domain-containing protein [Campylobacterota bacterium]|nr:type IV pili methyl-accepting chemotaxis transducer N-terminal domain-containing protein [Campylobacterota bacterium]
MQKQLQKTFLTLITGLLLSSGLANAQEDPKPTAAVETNSANTELLNLAGKQRMLSQRIAKNYFYKGMGVNTTKSKKQLDESLAQFNQTLKKLDGEVQNKKIKKMIMFINLSNDDFMSMSSEDYSLENGALVLDLSESMLEGSQYIVKALKENSKQHSSELVDLAGKQRMLSQRIAKYYISYQAGIKDKNSIVQMNEAVKKFTEAQKKLMNNKTNSAEINAALQKVDKLWKVVYDFYLDIEEGGLPVIVYNTTDDIMKEMNRVTNMYVKLQK